MEKPVQHLFTRKRIIQQFLSADGTRQDGRGLPGFLLFFLIPLLIEPAGTCNAFKHQRGSTPTGGRFFASQLQIGIKLFRIAEILACHVSQRLAFNGYNALIAVHIGPLVASEGQIPLAEQRRSGRRFKPCEPFLIQLGIAAQRPRMGAISQQHGKRAIPLGLQAEGAFEFQRGGEARGQRHRLTGDFCDLRSIIMTAEQGIRQRPQAHQAAAYRPFIQMEGQDGPWYYQIGHRWAAEGIEHGPISVFRYLRHETSLSKRGAGVAPFRAKTKSGRPFPFYPIKTSL